LPEKIIFYKEKTVRPKKQSRPDFSVHSDIESGLFSAADNFQESKSKR
jgi:hypothetical protein